MLFSFDNLHLLPWLMCPITNIPISQHYNTPLLTVCRINFLLCLATKFILKQDHSITHHHGPTKTVHSSLYNSSFVTIREGGGRGGGVNSSVRRVSTSGGCSSSLNVPSRPHGEIRNIWALIDKGRATRMANKEKSLDSGLVVVVFIITREDTGRYIYHSHW